VDQSPSWEANSHSASREIPHCLWNPKVYHRVHKSPPLVPIPNHMNLVRKHLRSIQVLFSHLCLSLPSGLLPTRGTHFSSAQCVLHVDQSRPPWFYHPDNVQWSEQIMKLLGRYSAGLRAGRSGFWGSISNGGWEFFSPPPRPERLWGQPSLLSNGYQGFFLWG
jgi:hypothetical protein